MKLWQKACAVCCSYRLTLLAARRPLPSGTRRKRRLSRLVGISVAAGDHATIAITDARYSPGAARQVERAAGPQQHSPEMPPSRRQARRDDRSHQIAGGAAKVPCLLGAMARRAAIAVRPTPLAHARAGRPDRQWGDAGA